MHYLYIFNGSAIVGQPSNIRKLGLNVDDIALPQHQVIVYCFTPELYVHSVTILFLLQSIYNVEY